MNIRLCAVLAVFSLFVNLAWAEPVYLECPSGEKREFSVKLDESNGKITHTNKDGDVFNAEGYFSANTVTYKLIRVNPTGNGSSPSPCSTSRASPLMLLRPSTASRCRKTFSRESSRNMARWKAGEEHVPVGPPARSTIPAERHWVTEPPVPVA